MLSLPVDVGVGETSAAVRGHSAIENGAKMVTWQATIRINATGDQQRVRVQAMREFDAKQLIKMMYKDAAIIAGPVRVDLMRAI